MRKIREEEKVKVKWIKAHTGGKEERYELNRIADEQATKAKDKRPGEKKGKKKAWWRGKQEDTWEDKKRIAWS